MLKSSFNLLPKILGYRFFRVFNWPKILPINLTLSVTNMCNSRCRTCFIWKLYREKPHLREEEFKLWEFERVFESIGDSIFWATISGGEPFLRPDLPKICEALVEYCSPKIINIPTNALLPKVIEDKMRKILNSCDCSNFVVNLSLDGLEDKHDKIRNVPGNFNLFLETYKRLSDLKMQFPNLEVGIHSVVSKFSIDGLLDVYDFALKIGADSYITEVAENRTELFTMDKDITPDPDRYGKFVSELSERIRMNSGEPGSVSKITQAFRLVYYQIAAEELKERRQIIPCYAGFASCQINPYGDVWPCCILGYDKSMGNLRENEYNFKKVWFSKKADEIRRYIKNRNCACPLANAHYTNILCNFTALIKVLGTLIG